MEDYVLEDIYGTGPYIPDNNGTRTTDEKGNKFLQTYLDLLEMC
jgi:hypothetical protein